MDLESIKAILVKQQQQTLKSGGIEYVTEKLYMLLQLYLQNKGWNSAELLQCFNDLKDTPMLPNSAYLQIMANRLALDSQGRLVLRENGKIVLPFEHFANAVMLKHMSGPHGLHLSLEATIRAVVESYTIGRENFGMEKEFIVEVVQSCPNPACRYYKSHVHPFEASQSNIAPGNSSGNNSNNNMSIDLTDLAKNSQLLKQQQQQQLNHQQQQQQQQAKSQQHLSNIIMQQNRALAQQSLEKFGNLSAIEKQRMMLQQLDKKHYNAAVAAMCPPNNNQSNSNILNNPATNPLMSLAAANNVTITTGVGVPIATNNSGTNMGSNLTNPGVMKSLGAPPNLTNMVVPPTNPTNKLMNHATGTGSSSLNSGGSGVGSQGAAHRQQTELHLQQQMLINMSNQVQMGHSANAQPSQSQSNLGGGSGSTLEHHQPSHSKINEYIRNSSNIESSAPSSASVDSIAAANKDLLALHNGAWGLNNSNSPITTTANNTTNPSTSSNNNLADYRGEFVGQEKIVRAFTELMRNMAKMKTFIRPSMCKPYGKQSESLQKTLMDTIQLVQSLRNCLPAPHIPVSSWKSEDRHRQGIIPNEANGNYDAC